MDVGKIKTGVKRFFSNPNTVTFFLVIVLIVIIYLVYSYMISRAIAPTSIPYCTTENGSSLLQSSRNIIHKYVAPGYYIPKNSFFYADALADSSIANKTLLSDIRDDYTKYSLKVDFHSTYGCSIMPGNYIDVYIRAKNPDDDGKLIFTWFMKSVQVIKVFDNEGHDVFTERDDEDKVEPEELVFILPKQYAELMVKAEHLSKYEVQLIPVPRNAGYTENPLDTEVNPIVEAVITANSVV